MSRIYDIYAHKNVCAEYTHIKIMRRIYAHKNICAEYTHIKIMRRIYAHKNYVQNICA